jgi:hypothetical protein
MKINNDDLEEKNFIVKFIEDGVVLQTAMQLFEKVESSSSLYFFV